MSAIPNVLRRVGDKYAANTSSNGARQKYWAQFLSTCDTTTRSKIGHLFKSQSYVHGEWVSSHSNFAVHDPATQEELVRVTNSTVPSARSAIDSAYEAQATWKLTLPEHRCALTQNVHDKLVEHVSEMSRILSIESGKPLHEAHGEVMYAASFAKFYAQSGNRVLGDVIPSNVRNRRIFVFKEPVGVCGIITPWNFPLAMIVRKVAPALVAGCSVVIKPAPSTPLSALAFGQICEDVGLPPGLVNVLPCDETNSTHVGLELCSNKKVRKLSFTGSTASGSLLSQQAASTVKKIDLELGGQAPFIVFDDANIDRAVNAAMISKFRNNGQACVAANRFYVHSKVIDEFTEKFAARAAGLVIGHGFDDGVDVGPLINKAAYQKTLLHVRDAIERGGEIICGGLSSPTLSSHLNGSFFSPTLISMRDNAEANQAKILREESFGPIGVVQSFVEEEEVLAKANGTDAGLASYVWTRDLERSFRVVESLEFGMVGVNSGFITSAIAPCGGMKMSGVGREGSHEGLEEYLETKYAAFDSS